MSRIPTKMETLYGTYKNGLILKHFKYRSVLFADYKSRSRGYYTNNMRMLLNQTDKKDLYYDLDTYACTAHVPARLVFGEME